MLDKFKNLYKIQKESKKIKKELRNTHIEAEENGVIVIIDGEQNVVSVKIPEEMKENLETLQKYLVSAFNKAIKKSQQVAAEKMKGIMGDMGLPGM